MDAYEIRLQLLCHAKDIAPAGSKPAEVIEIAKELNEFISNNPKKSNFVETPLYILNGLHQLLIPLFLATGAIFGDNDLLRKTTPSKEIIKFPGLWSKRTDGGDQTELCVFHMTKGFLGEKMHHDMFLNSSKK